MTTSRARSLLALLLLLAPLPAAAQGRAAAAWSGVYVGAHAGVGWNDLFYVEPDDPAAALSPELRGFAGGVLGGYARPLSEFVIGMEVDMGTASGNFGSDSPGGNDYTALDLGWNSHLRGRVARPVGGIVPFATAGLAALRIKVDDEDTDFGEGTATHLGWTVGAGVDAAVTSRLAVRAEFLHDDYGRSTHSISAPPGEFFPAYDVVVEGKSNVLRAAVLYRF